MRKIACLAGALALAAGSAFAEKARSEKDNEVQVRQDRRDVEHRDDKKLSSAARSDLEKSHAKLYRDEREPRTAPPTHQPATKGNK